MIVHYNPIGGNDGIGPSAHYLRIGRHGMLLDAGLDPQKDGEEALPDFSLLEGHPLDAIFITHAHLDHIGGLPMAIRERPHARVFMTPATVELTEQMLRHSLQVQRKRLAKDRRPSYDEDYLEAIRYIYQGFDYGRTFPLHDLDDGGLRFSFWDAGHILGSAGVLIEKDGRRIFYTGNTRKSPQFILQGARYPDPPIDVLITESTYGDNAEAETVTRTAELKRFAEVVSERLRLGGIVLLPVFALGRTQEMMAMIQHLRMRRRIPIAPLYVTGLGLKINRTYDRLLHKVYPDLDRGTLRAMTYDHWYPGRKLKGPALLLATSGMMIPGTASFDTARRLAADPRNAICFVGYADPETPGGRLRDERQAGLRRLFGVEELPCAVEVFQFSAHSNRLELMSMIRRLRPRRLVLVHGEPAAMEWLRDRTRAEFPDVETDIPEGGVWQEWSL